MNVKTTIIQQRHPKINSISTLREGPDSIVLIDSPLGTGKTKLARDIAAQHPNAKIAYISPSISLSETAAKIFNFECYLNKKRKSSDRIAICCNSIMQLDSTHYDILIIDEPDQVIDMLLGPTIKSDKREIILNHFIDLIKNSTQSLILQHKITDTILDLIRMAGRIDDVHLYVNQYKPWDKLEFNEVEGTYHNFVGILTAKAQALKAQKRKFAVACNVKKKTKEIALAMRSLGLHTLEIHADNATDSAQKDFFEHPTQASKHYDCIVYSPKVTSGVSIENNEYTDTFGALTNGEHALAPSTFVQMLARNRCLSSLTYWTSKHKMEYTTSEDEAAKSIIDLANIQSKIVDDELVFEPYKLTWIDKMRIKVEMRRNAEKNNAAETTRKLLEELGGPIIQKLEQNKKIHKMGQKTNLEAQKQRIAIEAKEIADENDITPRQFRILSEKNNITSRETVQIKRYRMQDEMAVALKDKDIDVITKYYTQYDDKRVHSKAEMWEIAFAQRKFIKGTLESSLKSGKFPAAFGGTLFAKHMILNALLKHIGATYKGGEITWDGREFTLFSFVNSPMGQFINKNKEAVNLCGLGGKVTTMLNAKIIALWLKKLGIRIRGHVERNGKKLFRSYVIVEVDVDVIATARRRFAAKKTFQKRFAKTTKQIWLRETSTTEEILNAAKELGLEVTKQTKQFIDKAAEIYPSSVILELMEA